MYQCGKTIQKMINFDNVINEEIKEHNPSWPQILDHSYRIWIIRWSGSRYANSLFNLIGQQPDIDKMYWYAKYSYEVKYQFLINKRESTSSKHFKDSKVFIKFFNNMDNIYENIKEYNPNKKCKMLIAFDNMIADMLRNKKLNLIVSELFIRG